MRFCMPHWEQLRAAIDAVGLTALVADNGETAAANLAQAAVEGTTVDNFDPLMSAHMAIWANSAAIAQATYRANPLMMMTENADHPEWDCPVCCLNWLHVDHLARCTKPDCDYPPVVDYAWMIERAATDALAAWQAMKP